MRKVPCQGSGLGAWYLLCDYSGMRSRMDGVPYGLHKGCVRVAQCYAQPVHAWGTVHTAACIFGCMLALIVEAQRWLKAQ